MKRPTSPLLELTPTARQCIIGACPAVFVDQVTDEIVLIGRHVSRPDLAGRVGKGEAVVSLDRELLVQALKALDKV